MRNEENLDFLQKKNFSRLSNPELLRACGYHTGLYQRVKDGLECYISLHFPCCIFSVLIKKKGPEKTDVYGIPESCCQSCLWVKFENTASYSIQVTLL
jgi:hypothetical protein